MRRCGVGVLDLDGGGELHLLHLGQILQGLQAEGAQEVRGGAVEDGAAGRVEAAVLLDQLFIQQGGHGIGAVHPAQLLHEGLRGGLIVGDNRQRLELRGRKLGGLAGLQRLGDPGREVVLGAHLPAVLQTEDADAPALKGVGVGQLPQRLAYLVRVGLGDEAQPLRLHRLARGKEDRLTDAL